MTVLLQKPIHKIHIKYKITNNKHRGSVPQTFTNCPFPIFFSYCIFSKSYDGLSCQNIKYSAVFTRSLKIEQELRKINWYPYVRICLIIYYFHLFLKRSNN